MSSLTSILTFVLAFFSSDTDPHEGKDFIPWHSARITAHLGGTVEQFFAPSNGIPGRTQNTTFLPGLQELRGIVAKAQADGKRLRGFGSKGSTTNSNYDNEYLVGPGTLNYVRVGFGDQPLAYIEPAFQQNSRMHRLVFVQAGVIIKYLHPTLEAHGLTLATTGDGDGQRLVGAISTGTHGSANQVGSIHDSVLGVHLVLPDRDVYIQRQSVEGRAVTEAFASEFLNGTVLINNDEMFYAAVVGLGAFGIIHGVLIEAEPQYYLEFQELTVPKSALGDALTSLQVGQIGFTGFQEDEIPFDATFTLNIFGEMAVVRAMKKVASEDVPVERRVLTSNSVPQPPAYRSLERSLIFDVFVNFLPSSLIPKFIKPWLYGWIIDQGMQDRADPDDAIPTLLRPSELFRSSLAPDDREEDNEVDGNEEDDQSEENSQYRSGIPTKEFEFSIPLIDFDQAWEVIMGALNEEPVPGAITLRYVKASNATLAFTRFVPTSVSVGVYAFFHETLFPDLRDVTIPHLIRRLQESGVPHVFHPGKNHPFNDNTFLYRTYGTSAMESFGKQRFALLGIEGCSMFTNDWMESIGLDVCIA